MKLTAKTLAVRSFAALGAVGTITLSTPSSCVAAAGIDLSGYGVREQAMGGASIATSQSGLAAALNPAGMAFVGNRLDIGFGVMLTNAGSEFDGKDYAAKHGVVPFPEFGYNAVISDRVTLGVSSWGSGGGIDYGKVLGDIPGNSNAYSQGVFVHIAPTVTYKFGADRNHAIAFSLVGALSTFRIAGVEAQTNQPNPDRDWKPGYGYKIGWLSQLTPALSVGAFYGSKVIYLPYSHYATILPDGGRFEEPEYYGAGLAIKPNDRWLVAYDWVRYNYGSTHILGNAVDFSNPLGSSSGPGFGLTNINVHRIGVACIATEKLTLRAGAEFAQEPVVSKNTAFTYLLPVTPKRTYTIGGSYQASAHSEVSFAYALSPRTQVYGSGVSTGTNPYAALHYFAFEYSRKF